MKDCLETAFVTLVRATALEDFAVKNPLATYSKTWLCMCWGAAGTVFLLGFLWGKGSQELGQWLEQGPRHWSLALQGLKSQWKPGEEETVPWEVPRSWVDGWGRR